MTRLCPECRESGAADDALACPHHGLFLVPESALDQRAAAPLLRQRLDEKHALVDIVGGGGYGTIYRGVQPPLGREVAVKVLHDVAFAHKVVRDRFVREAQALDRLGSPNTVRLLDYGVTRTGPVAFRNVPYIVMELLDGETLEDRLKRGVLSRAEIALIVHGIAESLAEARASGIVHRDLKPSNVLLTHNHDGQQTPRLIDFGIARLDDATKSASGFGTGTPADMAPEQARGLSEIGPSADQHALAVMAFEMLTGHPPFQGPDIVSILKAHCEAPRLPWPFPVPRSRRWPLRPQFIAQWRRRRRSDFRASGLFVTLSCPSAALRVQAAGVDRGGARAHAGGLRLPAAAGAEARSAKPAVRGGDGHSTIWIGRRAQHAPALAVSGRCVHAGRGSGSVATTRCRR